MPFRVLVGGSPYVRAYEFIHAKLDELLAGRLPDVQSIHRGRQRPDRIAEAWAAVRGLSWRAVFDTTEALAQVDAVLLFVAPVPWVAKTAEADLAREARVLGLSVRVVTVPWEGG